MDKRYQAPSSCRHEHNAEPEKIKHLRLCQQTNTCAVDAVECHHDSGSISNRNAQTNLSTSPPSRTIFYNRDCSNCRRSCVCVFATFEIGTITKLMCHSASNYPQTTWTLTDAGKPDKSGKRKNNVTSVIRRWSHWGKMEQSAAINLPPFGGEWTTQVAVTSCVLSDVYIVGVA